MSNKSYTIVTVCTHAPQQDYYCFEAFKKSLRGEPILVLDREYTNYSGLMSKPKGLHRAIKEKLISTKYILFSDCFDFIFTKSPRDLMLNFFNESGTPIKISCERNCFPDTLKDKFDEEENYNSYKYLNSGLIVGETDAILTCLETMDLTDATNDHWDTENNCQISPNDQFEWMKVYLNQPVPISMDKEQKLCNTLHQHTLDDLDFSTPDIRNKETGAYPLSIHFNGNAKSENNLLPTILKHLNLL